MLMEGRWGVGFWGVMLCLAVFLGWSCAQGDADNVTAVYIVTLKQAPASHSYDELRVMKRHHVRGNGSEGMSRFDKPRYNFYWEFCFNLRV